jgi:hypothetical protein
MYGHHPVAVCDYIGRMEKDLSEWEGWIVPTMKRKGAAGPLTDWPLPWQRGANNAPHTPGERFKPGDEVIYETGLEITRGEFAEFTGVVEAVTAATITVRSGSDLRVIDWKTGKLWDE